MKSESIPAMIVEDNREARLLLEKYLAGFPDIHLIASLQSVDEATLAFLKHRPELVFLDVELGDRTGFEFLENIRGIASHLSIIFTTAFDHYAVEAIKHSAFDFLLKPVNLEELSIAILRYRDKLTSVLFETKLNSLQSKLNDHKPLKLNKNHGFVMVNPDEILYCQADWNYTEIIMADTTHHMVALNIGHLEKQLPAAGFIRANRSLILNLKYLQQVDKAKGICILKNGEKETTIPLSVSKIRKLERMLDERMKK
jgi:two-component system, LytTR family, response regulator